MYERLLVAVDHSEVSDRVIAAARDIASMSKCLFLNRGCWAAVRRDGVIFRAGVSAGL